MDKKSIVVCSKNRGINETPSKLSVNLNDDLICNEDEYFTVKLCSFNMIKSFYSVQEGLNDEFHIYLSLNGSVDEAYVRKIPQGNYTVNTLIETLRIIFIDNIIEPSYDKRLNKFLFKRLANPISDGYDVSIVSINCGIILGTNDNEEFTITTEGVLSPNFINISGYEAMLIKVGGDISIENTYMNLTSEYYLPSQVLTMINLQSYMPMDSITLNTTDDPDANKFVINSKKIHSFTIDIVNENNIPFPQMSNYVLNLCFEKHTKKDLMLNLVSSVLSRFNDLLFYITYLFRNYNIGGDFA